MNRKTMRKAIRSPLLALALIAVFAGSVLATPSSGFGSTVITRGTMTESVHFNTGEIKFQTKDPVDFVTVTVTIAPGGSSGWHAHPGVLLVTVASGSETFYDQHCSATVHAAGTSSASFVESGDDPFLAHNESATIPVVVYVTYIVPAGTTALRIDKANPGCPLLN
jgi:quercetin dioxygenase-like cupin family protein